VHGIREDLAAGTFAHRLCPDCAPTRQTWLRPDITWFEDAVNQRVFATAEAIVARASLFVSIGTSGAVWPAAGFAHQARDAGARMIEINPEDNDASALYDERVRASASVALPMLFPLG
jgi:NAD-dependent deacetylase